MIDPNTQEELQTIHPEVDQEQAQTDALAMDNMLQEEQQVPEQSDAEAGIISSVVKPIAKILGMETASDVAQQVGKEAGKSTPPPKEPKVDLSAWANRKILQTKPEPKKPKIGEMVVKKPKPIQQAIEPIQKEAEAKRLFTAVERGESPKFNEFDPEKEAANLESSSIDQFSDKDSWQINFNTLRDDDDIKSVIAHMAESNKEVIDFERRGVIGDQQLFEFAKDLNADPQFISDVLARESGGAIPPAEYIIAMRQVLDQSAVKLKQLADDVSANLSPQAKIDFVQQFEFHRNFQAKFMGVRAEFGRGMRALGVPVGADEHEMSYVLNMMERNIDITKAADMISKAETTRGINSQVDALNNGWKYASDLTYTAYMSSMLSGLSTQILNIGGTLSNMATNIAERKVASWLPKGSNAVDEVVSGEVTAMLMGYKSAFNDGLKAFWKTFTTGDAYKGMMTYVDNPDMKLPSQQFKLTGVGGTLADAAFKTITFPIRNVMGGTDAFFTVINERAQLASTAYREAINQVKSGQISPEQFQKVLGDMLDNPSDEILLKAKSFSDEMQYKEYPGEITKDWTKAISGTPGARWVLPFVRTLSNITRQTLGERTPIALLRKKFYDDINAGGSQRQLALTKLGMGSGILATSLSLAYDGKITGPIPDDKATRDAWKAAGIKPYSFVFEDEGRKVYVPYTGIEPYASFFGISASIADYDKKSEFFDPMVDEEKRYNNLMTDLLYVTSENTMNKTFAVNMQTFFESLGGSYKSMERLVASYANTMIPYAGLRRNITKEIDDTKRSTDGVLQYIQSQIPIMSKELPAVRDIFGEEVKHDYTWVRWSPSYETSDPVRLEIQRLNEATQRMAAPDFRDKFGSGRISPKDREEWLIYSRRDRVDSQGRNLHDNISDIINSEDYKNDYDYFRVERIKTFIQNWDKKALIELAKDNPELHEKLTKTEQFKRASAKAKQEGKDWEQFLEDYKAEQEDEYGVQ